jgi:hypothetical protein
MTPRQRQPHLHCWRDGTAAAFSSPLHARFILQKPSLQKPSSPTQRKAAGAHSVRRPARTTNPPSGRAACSTYFHPASTSSPPHRHFVNAIEPTYSLAAIPPGDPSQWRNSVVFAPNHRIHSSVSGEIVFSRSSADPCKSLFGLKGPVDQRLVSDSN